MEDDIGADFSSVTAPPASALVKVRSNAQATAPLDSNQGKELNVRDPLLHQQDMEDMRAVVRRFNSAPLLNKEADPSANAIKQTMQEGREEGDGLTEEPLARFLGWLGSKHAPDLVGDLDDAALGLRRSHAARLDGAIATSTTPEMDAVNHGFGRLSPNRVMSRDVERDGLCSQQCFTEKSSKAKALSRSQEETVPVPASPFPGGQPVAAKPLRSAPAGSTSKAPGTGWGLKDSLLGVLGGGAARGSLPKTQEFLEEEEWSRRQEISGVVGRMVRYGDSEVPTEDILGLRRSDRGRIVVTGVKQNGRADRMGVKPGDELKSITGWNGFAGCPAAVIHTSLVAPVTLVFVGFVGKLQAEVRVERPVEHKTYPPGLASDIDIFPGRVPMQHFESDGGFQPSVLLCDEVVFLPQDAPSPPATDAGEPGAIVSAEQSLRRDGPSFYSPPSSSF